MSPRLPRVTAGQVARVLKNLGFQIARQSGSHRIYRNAVGSRVTLPFHAGKEGLRMNPQADSASLLKQAGKTVKSTIAQPASSGLELLAWRFSSRPFAASLGRLWKPALRAYLARLV